MATNCVGIHFLGPVLTNLKTISTVNSKQVFEYCNITNT